MMSADLLTGDAPFASPTIDPFYRGDAVEIDASLFRPGASVQARTWFVNFPATGSSVMELCTAMNGGGTWSSFPVDKVKLVRRGNHFRHQFGMPLSFANLADEAAFWREL